MRTINHSVRGGGMLTCSFREADFGDFILKKKREAAHLPLKKAMRNFSPLVPSCIVIGMGRRIALLHTCMYSLICVSTSFPAWSIIKLGPRTQGGPAFNIPFSICAPSELRTAMRVLLKHNFCCGVLYIAAGLKLLHYNMLNVKAKLLPYPSSIWTATNRENDFPQIFPCSLQLSPTDLLLQREQGGLLEVVLWINIPSRMRWSAVGVIISQLIVELFNGAKCTLVKSDITPITDCLISANFSMSERSK